MIGSSLYLIFILDFLFSGIEVINTNYEKGLTAYQNNQYELAIQTFEKILKNNWDSPELYYNLGNAYYRIGKNANSIWAYESCLKLNPRNENAKYNLDIANLKVKDQVLFPEPPLYLKWYIIIKEKFTVTQWVNISLFLLFIYFLIISIIKIKFIREIYRISKMIIIVFFISLTFTLHSLWTYNSISYGIIYTTTVDVISEPNIFSTRLFKVHEGLKVNVVIRTQDWTQIELLDGKSGWVENSKIKIIE